MLSFAGRPNGQLLGVGGTFWKEQAGNWVARVPEPEKRESLPGRESGEGRSMVGGGNPQ